MFAPRAIGLDLGGTRLKAALYSSQGHLLLTAERPTHDGQWAGDRPAFAAAARDIVREFEAAHGPALLGVAAPGLTDPSNRRVVFMPGRLQGLEQLDWTEVLGRSAPVPVLNDAQAALLGEIWLGAAPGQSNVILLTLGTGVGGAAMVDGHLLRGAIGRAGHLGHLSLDPCGAPDIVGTPGSLEDAIGECTLSARSGGRFTRTEDLLMAARHGDVEARAVWDRSIRSLAAAVASLINILDCETVLLGGGITGAGEDLFTPLESHLQRMEWRPGGHRVRLVAASLGGLAGTAGAAWQALRWAGVTPLNGKP